MKETNKPKDSAIFLEGCVDNLHVKEVDHARRLLENRMNNNFFGGEQDD